MATYIFPAIRGHIGSTTYYTVTMTARELATVARPANELAEWTGWTISERIQRDVTVNRVRGELIPYLLESRDRFFGSLIVIAYECDLFEFEPLDTMGTKVRGAHKGPSARMGFLTIEGGRMVALDGQHRLVGLREIINGNCEASPKKIAAVADDEICVVFLKFESLEKTRRIFNKVNRHARPTTPHDNILTSEDDGYAIVTRWLLEDEPPLGLSKPNPPLAIFDAKGEPLVEWKRNNLPQFTQKLTTLSAVYQTVEAACDANGLTNFDEKHRVNRPPNDELQKAYAWSAMWWNLVLDRLNPIRKAVAHPDLIPDMRQYREKWSLLFRPVAQVALFRGIERCARLGLSASKSIDAMNRINWRASAPIWEDVIIRANGHMIANQQAIRLGGQSDCVPRRSRPDDRIIDQTPQISIHNGAGMETAPTWAAAWSAKVSSGVKAKHRPFRGGSPLSGTDLQSESVCCDHCRATVDSLAARPLSIAKRCTCGPRAGKDD